MKKILRRTLGTAAITAVVVGGAAAPASAAVAPAPAASSDDGVQVVDQPDTSGLHNDWTFAPLGVPVLGLIQSVAEVPGKVTPGGC
jgi:hypothetical protein